MQYATAIYAHLNYELAGDCRTFARRGCRHSISLALWARIPLFVFSSRTTSNLFPCLALCNDISQAPFPRNHVTCVVVMGNDVVSRDWD
jgi:hypothetical protein